MKQKTPSPLSSADIIRLFEYEMQYPIPIILQFREVAVAAFYAQELFQRKKRSSSSVASASSRYTSVTTQGIASAGRRLSSVPLSRSSFHGGGAGGGGGLGGASSTPTNSIPAQDFQQAMSWSDVLHLVTILRDEQKGIASIVSQNDEEMSSHPPPLPPPSATSQVGAPSAPASQEQPVVTPKDQKLVPKSDPAPAAPQTSLTPTKQPSLDEGKKANTATVDSPSAPSAVSATETSQENKKISLGISLKKGGRPVEMTVPTLKSSSMKASSLFSSMKQGFEQLGGGGGGSGLDSSSSSAAVSSDQQTKGTPTKKSSTNSESVPRQETILEVGPSRLLRLVALTLFRIPQTLLSLLLEPASSEISTVSTISLQSL
jgi:hypothetical protein